MIKVGDKVKIVYSHQLADMKMIPLVNRMGEILDIKIKDTKTPGVWLKILNDLDETEEWFVPIQSIRTKEYYYRKRNTKILKSFEI
jgi:hypothetical protein